MTYNQHKHFYFANQWKRFESSRIEKNCSEWLQQNNRYYLLLYANFTRIEYSLNVRIFVEDWFF